MIVYYFYSKNYVEKYNNYIIYRVTDPGKSCKESGWMPVKDVKDCENAIKLIDKNWTNLKEENMIPNGLSTYTGKMITSSKKPKNLYDIKIKDVCGLRTSATGYLGSPIREGSIGDREYYKPKRQIFDLSKLEGGKNRYQYICRSKLDKNVQEEEGNKKKRKVKKDMIAGPPGPTGPVGCSKKNFNNMNMLKILNRNRAPYLRIIRMNNKMNGNKYDNYGNNLINKRVDHSDWDETGGRAPACTTSSKNENCRLGKCDRLLDDICKK